MTRHIDAPPALVRRTSIGSIQVKRLTVSIGAELNNINLADAAEDDATVRRSEGSAPESTRCCSRP